jgi:hypothetical protein
MDRVAHAQRAKGMQARPKLEVRVRFPSHHGSTIDQLNHLSADAVSILKVRASIDDDAVDDLRVYFDPRLNLQKSTWTYAEDTRGRYYWASDAQLDDMKRGDGFVSFDVDHPKRGRHEVEVVALVKEQPGYEMKFVVNAD